MNEMKSKSVSGTAIVNPPESTRFPLTGSIVCKTVKEMVYKTKKFHLEVIGKRSGDVVIITGGARGIGEVVVRNLLQCDFHVVMGIRQPEAGKKLVSDIRQEGILTGETTFIALDLKSLKSVREFANTVLQKFPKIHILICNAGIMFTPYELTNDGFESQFQVDYLSHFLLTDLLLPRMKQTAKSTEKAGRIVNVSSVASYSGTLKNISDIESRHKLYNRYSAYCDSKLAQVAASNYLDKKLNDESANVNVYSLHPGAIPTDLHPNEYPEWAKKKMRTVQDGADVVMCAVGSPKFEKKGGVFLMNCQSESPNSQAKDKKLQKQLWEKSYKLLGME